MVNLQVVIEETYKPCCTRERTALSFSDTPQDYQNYIDSLIAKIWEAKKAPNVDLKLLESYGAKLSAAILKGYGSDYITTDFRSPDYQMVQALKTNVWQFSAAKTHTQLRQMSAALLDANGKVRSFDDFRLQAQQISGMQLGWLRTEYDTAIAGAQLAALWQRIQLDKELFPLLQFVAVMDEHTSDICKNLDGIILPVDHPFWKTWFPPNHYNERATVKQLRGGEITSDDKIIYPEKVPAIFKINLGERGLAFPPDHPYYTDIPAHVINNATLYMPVKEQYVVRYKSEDGATLSVHRKTELESKGDLKDLIALGKKFADRGFSVDILPEIHAAETSLRSKLLPEVKGKVNPDLRVNLGYEKVIVEVEKPAGEQTLTQIRRRIAAGAKQSENVLVILNQEFDDQFLKRLADERFKAVPNLKSITFVTSDGEMIQYRK